MVSHILLCMRLCLERYQVRGGILSQHTVDGAYKMEKVGQPSAPDPRGGTEIAKSLREEAAIWPGLRHSCSPTPEISGTPRMSETHRPHKQDTVSVGQWIPAKEPTSSK